MKITNRLLIIAALFALALPLIFTGNAGAVVYNPDGLSLNATTGQWDLPTFGATGVAGCYDGTTSIVNPSPATRFDCYNLQGTALNAITTQSACIATGITPSGWTAAAAIGRWSACSKGGYSANTTNALTDCATNGGTVSSITRCNRSLAPAACTSLPTYTFTSTGTSAATYACTTTGATAAQCAAFTGTTGGVSYLGSAVVSGATTTCSIYISDATSCTAAGGTISTTNVDQTRGFCGANWVFKDGTVGDWGSSVRNNCTKCHNGVYMASAGTDFELSNGALIENVRSAGVVEKYRNASHKNASRKIPAAGFFAPGQGLVNVWQGTDGSENFGVFPYVPGGFSGANSAQVRRIDWVNGKIEDTTGGLQNLPTGVFTEWYWTFGYYGEDPERGVFNMEAASTGKPIAKQPACFKCHATGYVSPAAVDATKEPEKSFPGISWNGTTTYTPGSRPGVINFATAFTTDRNTNTKTTNTYGAWDQYGVVCSKCHNSAGGSHTSGGDGIAMSVGNGYNANAICGQCHIRASSSDWSVTAGTGALATRAQVGTGHPNWHATDFLNSPHARFTGTYAQVATSSMYNSAFGTVAGGGCTGCHNPHGSVREFFTELAAEGDPHGTDESLGPLEGVEVGCVDCHSVAQGNSYPITTFRHPTDPTKPTPWGTPDPCATCHMAGARHLFRVTTDVNYTTTQATAFPVKSDGVSAEAVWQDLKSVCQQCHSGHVDGIPFIQTADLRGFANGFHGGPVSPEAFDMDFTYTPGTNRQMLFTATGCPTGKTCNYKWDFGDGTTDALPTSGATSSHTYATGGTYSAQVIIVNVTDSNNAAKAKAFTVVSTNAAPVAVKTITQSGFTVNVIDASTDDATLPAGAVTVDWGNGTTSTGNAGTTISKLYTLAGSYIIKHKVKDAEGKVTWSANTQVTVPIKYTVSGSAMRLGGVIPVSGASIRLKSGTQVVKMTVTAANGTYTLNDVNPGSYTVEAVKSGLVFSSTPAAVVTNANVTGITITATR
ncbi:MAG: PKD domain-containing protein [Thermodesulfovibrionales bacterium]